MICDWLLISVLPLVERLPDAVSGLRCFVGHTVAQSEAEPSEFEARAEISTALHWPHRGAYAAVNTGDRVDHEGCHNEVF